MLCFLNTFIMYAHLTGPSCLNTTGIALWIAKWLSGVSEQAFREELLEERWSNLTYQKWRIIGK
jgi:hypothetical protein